MNADRRQRVLTLVAASLALFLVFLDNTIVNVALPSIQRSISATPSDLEWVVAGYVVSFAALILFFGRLGDRIGHRRVFYAGLTLFGAGSILAGASGNAAELIFRSRDPRRRCGRARADVARPPEGGIR